jgi:hypothetical protein
MARPSSKRLVHDRKQARRSEYDVATNAYCEWLRAYWKEERGNEAVLFATGLGTLTLRPSFVPTHVVLYTLIAKVRQSLVHHISFTIL